MNKRWVVIFAFCGVFVAGALVGGLVTSRSVPPPAPNAQHHGPPPPAPDLDRFAPAIMRRYTARLELDDAQREQLKGIVAEAEAALRALRAHSFHESHAIGDRMHAQVEPLLRPEQHERFEKLKKDVQKYRERERERLENTAKAAAEKPNGKAESANRNEERKPDERKAEPRDEKRDEPRKPEKRDSENRDERSSEKREEKHSDSKSEKPRTDKDKPDSRAKK